MISLDPKRISALSLSLIALTDISIILNVPVLRQVLGFTTLTLLPGFLLIQIVRVSANRLEKILYAVGLSVSFVLFVPLMMNFVYPRIGISQPISLLPLAATFSLILAVLTIVGYKKGALDFQITAAELAKQIDVMQSPPVLGAALIVALGILGGLFIRYDMNSLFSLLSTVSIVIIFLLVVGRRVPARFYPLYIVAIALAFQYSRTLASPNLIAGGDINYELYFADVVRAVGFWNPSYTIVDIAHSDYFGMLSVVFLPNVYSLFCNVDTVLVYELIYPVIFAFVPLGLYYMYRTNISTAPPKSNETSAFLAAFLFMAFFGFFLQLPREQIAELFLIVALLVILGTSLQGSKKGALFIVFTGSMIVSHYATSYLFLLFLFVLWFGPALVRMVKHQQKEGRPAVSAWMVAFASFIAVGWYMGTSGGAALNVLLQLGSHTYTTFTSAFFSTSNDAYVTNGLGGGVSGLPFTHTLARYWGIVVEVLLIIGLLLLIWRRKTLKVNSQFLLLSIASLFLLLILVAVPTVGSIVTGWRGFALALLFLAPCCIYAVEAIVERGSSWIRANEDLAAQLKGAALIAVIVPFFLFNYNFIFEITEHPANFAFIPSQGQNGRVIEYSDSESWSYLLVSPVPDQNVYAAQWISGLLGQSQIYADSSRLTDLIGYGHVSPDSANLITFSNLNQSLPENSYVYFGAANVQQDSLALKDANGNIVFQNLSTSPTLTAGNKIYSNGLAEFYYVQPPTAPTPSPHSPSPPATPSQAPTNLSCCTAPSTQASPPPANPWCSKEWICPAGRQVGTTTTDNCYDLFSVSATYQSLADRRI